ncbi:hypothetical protein EVAR_20080_1 [Eumeta japonica]|uniref:Uncharacterized protein n=1 Tax=Eumeta variegata TaxID=151549 RepID=A0A4C1UJJ7_EUMVA|nr:hypothetical protein EVAR_20080_1 [Eumeta japonica]
MRLRGSGVETALAYEDRTRYNLTCSASTRRDPSSDSSDAPPASGLTHCDLITFLMREHYTTTLYRQATTDNHSHSYRARDSRKVATGNFESPYRFVKINSAAQLSMNSDIIQKMREAGDGPSAPSKAAVEGARSAHKSTITGYILNKI